MPAGPIICFSPKNNGHRSAGDKAPPALQRFRYPVRPSEVSLSPLLLAIVLQISPITFSNGFSGRGGAAEFPCPTTCCFIPRGVYGAYLTALARNLIDSGEITHVRDRCLDLIESCRSVGIALESGDTINAEIVVSATGNEAKSVPGLPPAQPWTKDAVQENSQRSTDTDRWDRAQAARFRTTIPACQSHDEDRLAQK